MKHFVRILSLTLVLSLLSVTLLACGKPAKDPADAKAALEEAGYVVAKDDRILPATFTALGYSLTSVVTGSKIGKDDAGNTVVDHVSIYYFKDKDAATKALDKIKENEAADKGNSDESNWVAPTQSGSMVYYGTKAAVKAAK